ncbi:MAG: transposase [Thermodesulfobacteriota bacterium]
MARKPRIHIPGGFYHVILGGNNGQDIFFSDQDRNYFENLVQNGIDRFKNRIHAYCWMSNHVHMLIQVSEVSLSKIIQNLSFRYTNYINKKISRIGHLFQGRYKAILIDEERYLLELVRYIHLNAVRAKIMKLPEDYEWSGHLCYLGRKSNRWLTIEYVLSQFSKRQKTARRKYEEFIFEGLDGVYRREFHYGSEEGRILGDDRFIEQVLGQVYMRLEKKYKVEDIIDLVCKKFKVKREELISLSRQRELSRVRGIIAFMVAEYGDGSLSEYARIVRRDLSTLSIAVNQIRKELETDIVLQKQLRDMTRGLAR